MSASTGVAVLAASCQCAIPSMAFGSSVCLGVLDGPRWRDTMALKADAMAKNGPDPVAREVAGA